MADAAGRGGIIAGPPLPSSLTSRVGVGREEEGGEWKGWQNPLHEAVWTNNSEQLRQLVRKSFGPVQGGQNQRVGLDDEENQFTALYVASLKNDINSACVLLEAGASVDNGGAQGTPPLFSAAAKGNLELVTSPIPRKRIASAFHLHLYFPRGCPRLISLYAICIFVLILTLPFSFQVRLFVAFKCNLDLEDVRQGCSAIHIAADKGHLNVLDVLLDANIDVNKKSSNGEMTPLHHAASCGRLAAVKRLVRYIFLSKSSVSALLYTTFGSAMLTHLLPRS